ncbi:hypothetical protein KUCAC02_004494, partial [Chaenocephalus aceratus]
SGSLVKRTSSPENSTIGEVGAGGSCLVHKRPECGRGEITVPPELSSVPVLNSTSPYFPFVLLRPPSPALLST